MNPKTLRALCTSGLQHAPSQTLGAIRLVPLVRESWGEDLRLALRSYSDDVTFTRLDGYQDEGGRRGAPGTWYASYVPQGMIVGWSSTGEPAVALETGLDKRKRLNCGDFSIGLGHRMVRRTPSRSLRMLPLHVAMEGFLALHFRGPNMDWGEYSTKALTRGLTPRYESSFRGEEILGLEDALRVFEIHSGQCGVMVYVADALASVLIVGHPEDYAAMHAGLVKDFFGPLIWQYGCQYRRVQDLRPTATVPNASSLADLRRHVASMREDRAALYRSMAGGVFDREIAGETVYKLSPFTLERFITDLSLDAENHIGECIRGDDGSIQYLKTFRLSAAQTRRAHLLRTLHAHDWNLDESAKALKTDKKSLIRRIAGAGFGDLIHPHVLERALRG